MSLHLNNTPVLYTDRLTLRAFAPQDMEAGTRYLQTQRTVYMGGPWNAGDAWDHCASLIGHWVIHGFGLFAICLRGTEKAVGDCGLLRPYGYPENELGWGIWDTDLEGKGYVFEAAEAVRTYAYDTLGWPTLVSYIDPDNARSIALAKRLGCTLDTHAQIPDLPDWDGTLVYRHPNTAKGAPDV
ncbi:MAG: GNAT family N-acetyltransferase [Roseovarius sp.]